MQETSGASKKIKIRRSTLRDIDVLVSHRRKMWEEIGRSSLKKHPIRDPPYRRWLLDLIPKKRFIGFLAVASDGKVVGSGGVWLRDEHPKPDSKRPMVPYLLSMYTVPEFRRNGIAAAIVKEAMNWCKKKGYNIMRLNASKMGRSVYSDLGWERTWEMRVHL